MKVPKIKAAALKHHRNERFSNVRRYNNTQKKTTPDAFVPWESSRSGGFRQKSILFSLKDTSLVEKRNYSVRVRFFFQEN